ncbi:DUF5412 domain-containing protein [Bengtsoniella intestinalis]|uniref:DUF5412 domain-containing protein n=1 Tax=Bengtsoniella intestinalis TaxID=3073143 RepID=UPI00391FA2EB
MKKFKIVLVILITVIGLLGFGIYSAFFTIQNIEGQEILGVSESLDGTYSLSMYLNNGGATTSYAVLGTLKNNETGKEKNIYWQYKCEQATVEWIDDTTVEINGIVLDITTDVYDYRNK